MRWKYRWAQGPWRQISGIGGTEEDARSVIEAKQPERKARGVPLEIRAVQSAGRPKTKGVVLQIKITPEQKRWLVERAGGGSITDVVVDSLVGDGMPGPSPAPGSRAVRAPAAPPRRHMPR